jgi:DNA-binding MarR family transcriptional regulator
MHAVFFGLKRAFQSSLEWMKRVFEPHGLTPARFDMLFVIEREEFFSQQHLGTVLGVSGATVSRMLKSLRQLGLLYTYPDPDDRRRKLIELTEHGRAVLEEAIEAVLGSGLGGFAVASTVGWPSEPLWKPDDVARGISKLLYRLDRLREGFRDRALLEYGRGPDE